MNIFFKPRVSRAGFTMVELMMSMLSVSILAMLVGSLLVMGHRSWIDGTRKVELQRDATLAMEAVGNRARASTKGELTVSSDNKQLFFGDGSSVVWAGDQLILKPENLVLVREGVQSFQASILAELPSEPVKVILQLFDAESGGSSIMTGTFVPRNEPSVVE